MTVTPETALWISTRKKTCTNSDELLCHDIPCPRCELIDWAAFPEDLEIVCGGCGFHLIDDMMRTLGVNESKGGG
jgi:hypothetical protein